MLSKFNLNISEIIWVVFTTFVFLVAHAIYRRLTSKKRLPEGKRRVPTVAGGLPLIGHGLHIMLYKLNFIKDCYEKYGGIFQIKIFLANVIVICDRGLVSLYLRKKDESMSFAQAMDQLNFHWTVLTPELLGTENGINMVRKCVGTNQEALMSKVEDEGKRVIDELKESCKMGEYWCTLNDKMNMFLTRTSFACFVPIDLSAEFYKKLKQFHSLSEELIMASWWIPKWILKLTFDWRIRKYKKTLVPHFEKEIQKYMDDSSKSDSTLFRMATDMNLTNSEIAELIIGFMYISSNNTAAGLTNVLTLLALPKNSDWLKKIRNECEECRGDTSKLLAGQILNAFILETARLSSPMMSPLRRPEDPHATVGDYFIGDNVKYVALSPPMLMVYGDSSKVYHDPTEFLPERFIGTQSEPQSAPSHLTWGGGIHACPGKMFAIKQIKIALAQIILNFEVKLDQNLPELNYFSVAAFADRKVRICFSKRKL